MERRKALEWIVVGGMITIPQRQLPPVYIKKFNLFEQIYKEPIETALLVFRNGDSYTFTTNEDSRTAISIDYLERIEKKKIKDLALVVHNHWTPAPFSESNNRLYFRLKRKGFKGLFGIYYPVHKKIKYKDNSKK